jgi:hypothetical protein
VLHSVNAKSAETGGLTLGICAAYTQGMATATKAAVAVEMANRINEALVADKVIVMVNHGCRLTLERGDSVYARGNGIYVTGRARAFWPVGSFQAVTYTRKENS